MESENVSSNGKFTEFKGKTAQKIRVSDHITGLQRTNRPDDSFVVEMERFSHLTEKDMKAISRITRNQSRKGSVKKINHQNATNENSIIASSSPRAVSHGANTHEKPMIVTAGAAADYPALQPVNQIAVVVTAGDISSSPTERKIGDKRFGFRRLPSTSSTLHPRRILLFFATLSSMGTILLIYFTLSIGTKLGRDKTALN